MGGEHNLSECEHGQLHHQRHLLSSLKCRSARAVGARMPHMGETSSFSDIWFAHQKREMRHVSTFQLCSTIKKKQSESSPQICPETVCLTALTDANVGMPSILEYLQQVVLLDLFALPCQKRKHLQDKCLGGGPSEELRALRERMRINQRRSRGRQKERLKEAEEKVAKLTAELEAARLGQVLLPILSSQHSQSGWLCQHSKARARSAAPASLYCWLAAGMSLHSKARQGHLHHFSEARCTLAKLWRLKRVCSNCQYADAAIKSYMLG